MFLFSLVFLAILAVSTGQSGIPRYIQGQWIVADENLQYEDSYGQSPAVDESVWPEIPPELTEQVMVEDQNLPTTPEPYVVKEQDEADEAQESAVWKMVLVAAVLLVFMVGSVSVAYYLCVWRGGRIRYQLQKEGSA